jgi:hypothetical protein
MMVTSVQPGREILYCIALFLLSEYMKVCKLLLHVINGITDELSNTHDFVVVRGHRIVLASDHGLQLEIVI